ncbi:MAG TPA: ComEC/Rec2 family competence protein [Microvirga sp.]|jgi:competence protein ComEC|nr:ComEC/Rec2 family competence protein [Microvirga sp.]
MAKDNPRRGPRIRAAAAGLAPAGLLDSPWPAAGFGDWRAGLARCLDREVEQRRLFPWIAVFFGIGILLFFQADGQPALWAPVLGFALAAAGAVALRGTLWGLAALIALASVFAGFAAAVVRSRSVEAPALNRTIIAPLSGFVEGIEERPEGARLTIRVHAIGALAPAERPDRVRVSVREGRGLTPGGFLSAHARLLPPPEPAWPGGYDFARDAWFRGIGAVGSLVGRPALVAPPAPAPWDLRLAATIDAARNALARRIADAVAGPAGAVAAALVTGKRGFIEEPTNETLRAAGIYHIVSISGLHMVLAAGTFFWLARALLALSPQAALLWPVKKIAAVIAMAGAAAYCVFSGSEVATERSLVMTLVMLGAILADRPALSLRNLAVAALIVLAREPETLLGPSFQMSFGAVAALIALSHAMQGHLAAEPPSGWIDRALRWAWRGLVGLVAMTIVANLATAPFAAYHFQVLNPLGLIGNALALPLVSLVVMPAAVIGTLAYPFGLDRWVWLVMGRAVDAVLAVSQWVEGLSGSTVPIAAFGTAALVLMSAALLLAVLPASSLRWLAVLPAGVGLALAATPERFDLFVDREGAGAAIRGADGRLHLVGRPSAFVTEQWLRADGDPRRADDATLRQGARCDRLGCVVTLADGRAVAFVQDSRAFPEDCRRAAIVVTRLAAPPGCGATLVLDRPKLQLSAATAVLFPAGGTPEIRTARATGDPRPWTRTAPAAPPSRPVPARRPAPSPEDDEDGPEPGLTPDDR